MELTDRAREIREELDTYLAGKPFTWNPDDEVVTRVLNGLAAREKKQGARYCPCRLTTGDAEEDRKIVCPCAYHESEIAEDGTCHCRLFVAADGNGDASAATDSGVDRG